MNRALKYIAVMDMIFILFLALSGLSSGILGQIAYYLAFALPLFLAWIIKSKANAEFDAPSLKISAKNLALVIPAIVPTLALVFLISWVTSLLVSLTGYENTGTDVSGNIITITISYAVITAILEELLFRYVPIALLYPHTKRGAVLISAFLFSIVHFNPYQIPYAFVAGVVFAALDVAFNSIWPSVILHFANNLISIFWIRHSASAVFVTVYITLLAGLSILSFATIFALRSKYKKLLKR